MAIDFFDTELSKVQNRFSKVYGKQDVKDLRCMHKVIFAIIGLGLIKKQIKTENKVEDRKEFMRRRGIILSILDKAQHKFNERKMYERPIKKFNDARKIGL